MSMLSVVQRFCRRSGIDSPVTVLGSTDEGVLQVVGLLEEEGIDLAARGDWQELTFEATHTTLAAEDQGAVSAIAANGFDHFKPDTFWDRSLRLPVFVLDGQEWQAAKAVSLTGPRFQVRIRGGKLLANPTPTAGNTWAFEYQSKNWVLGADGTTYKQYFTLDTDTLLLPEHLLLMGLRWRWKKEEGLAYDEDFRTYETQVAKALGNNGLKKKLSMSNRAEGLAPGIFVPDGSWSIP